MEESIYIIIRDDWFTYDPDDSFYTTPIKACHTIKKAKVLIEEYAKRDLIDNTDLEYRSRYYFQKIGIVT